MAVFVATDHYILINAVNMSSMCTAAVVDVDADTQDSTAYGAGWRAFVAGLKKGMLTLAFNQDYAASQVHATLWPIFATVVTFEIRPTSAARAATNPGFTGSCLISKLTPVGAKVGDLSVMSVSWPTTGAVTPLTA